MKVYDVISKKRDGISLSTQEIDFMIQGYTRGEIPDYQMSAFLMAVYIRGMDHKETSDLTVSMLNSGDTADLSSIRGFKVDKHSTGGVGDTTTLVLAPAVSACNVPVAKMSGRGLGHTGGTLDKLESFPGFRVELSAQEFISNVNKIGIAVVGQTSNIAPADKKIYALRDVTATVSSIPLIAASIMSKKLAAGSDGIVLDVKTGAGAFMQTLELSLELARTMIEIGKRNGKKMNAVVTDMDQPLGMSIGNKLEVREAILTMMGKGHPALMEVCLTLGSLMLLQAGKCKDMEQGRAMISEVISSGKALNKFREFVIAQGGNPQACDDPDIFLCAEHKKDFAAASDGFISSSNALDIGRASFILGAGREKKEDVVNLDAGIIMHKRLGDRVRKGEIIASMYTGDSKKFSPAETALKQAFKYSKNPVESKLIYEII